MMARLQQSVTGCCTLWRTSVVEAVMLVLICSTLGSADPSPLGSAPEPADDSWDMHMDWASYDYVPKRPETLVAPIWRGPRGGKGSEKGRRLVEGYEMKNATVMRASVGDAYGGAVRSASFGRAKLEENLQTAVAGNCTQQVKLSKRLFEWAILELTYAASLVGTASSRPLALRRTTRSVQMLQRAYDELMLCFRSEAYIAERLASRSTTVGNPFASLSFLARAMKAARRAVSQLILLPEAEDAVRKAVSWDLGRWNCPYTWQGKGRSLAFCAMGYAEDTIGGVAGQRVVVTDDSDHDKKNPKNGTLRWAVRQAPAWITFSRNMKIVLKWPLVVRSETTIDGRGVTVKIQGGQVLMWSVGDVILHNLRIENVVGDFDVVHTGNYSTRIWVDHCDCSNGARGLLTVRRGSTGVTFSNNRLENHNFVMLLGARDDDYMDKAMRVTVYRNFFIDSFQRMPHGRFGWFHVVNNMYWHWNYYAVGGRVGAKLLTEKNVFVAGGQRAEVTTWFNGCLEDPDFDHSACLVSRDDLLMTGATYSTGLNCRSIFKPPYFIEVLDTKTIFNLAKQNAGPRIPAQKPAAKSQTSTVH